MTERAEGRVYKRKRISNPDDESQYVDIPVIYEANFKTMAEQAQERILHFNNGSDSSRTVRVQEVTSSANASQYVYVERIETFTVKIMHEQAQEHTFHVVNKDPPPIQPDGSNDPHHEEVHYVRYFKDNDSGSGVWVDVEIIDKMKLKDSDTQEWIYYLKHPELGDLVDDPNVPYAPLTAGFCDPQLPLVTGE